MIAKGNLHGGGAALARYLMTGEKGEVAELLETRGLDGFGKDPVAAFAILQRVAEAQTNCEKPFFHGQMRIAPGERLTDAQWRESVDRMEKRLGFTGQPRIVSFHIDQASGEKHLHVGWCRIDLEQMRAKDPSMYKNHLKQLSRTLEKDFALREVSNYRKPDDRTRAAGRAEFEESRRLKTDLKAIRNTILDCLQQSDNGKAFTAALGTHRMMLANGDRRDCFVVIDQAGGQHALNKRLTGLTLAAIRERLADLDRQQLPSVEEAKAQQRVRHPERGAEMEKVSEPAARGPYASLQTPQPAAEAKPERPLGKTAAAIHTVWNATRSGDFARGIEDRGLIMVYVTPEEARASERAHAFAKVIDRQNRALKEGFAVVDQRGNVTRIDQRATGDLWHEIQQRLAGIERDTLLSVAAAREVMKEANRATWQEQQREEREKARPPTSIEARIIECAEQARGYGAVIARDGEGRRLSKTEALAARFDKTGERISESATIFGSEAFAARLDQAGIAIARVTVADMTALAALRQDEERARLAAETNREARKAHHFAQLEAGELAAVTRGGNMHRLNPDKLRGVEIAAKLPSVTEARAAFEIDREKTTKLWAQRQADNAARAIARSEGRAGELAFRRVFTATGRTAQGSIAQVATTGIQGLKVLRAASKIVEGILGALGGLFGAAEPKRTHAQTKQYLKAEGNLETLHARAHEAAEQAKAVEYDDRDHVRKTTHQQADLTFSQRFGTPATREANIGRELDDDYGRERER